MINFEILKDKAIRSIYPNVVTIDLSNWKCIDDNNNIINLDDLLVQEKVNELQADYDSKQYQRDRAIAYPSWQDQLDNIFHNGIDAWKADIQAIKDQYPKPDGA